MCSLNQLQDGTYTIDDLADMHEALDLVSEFRRKAAASHKAT